jgi:hypothetical protein
MYLNKADVIANGMKSEAPGRAAEATLYQFDS